MDDGIFHAYFAIFYSHKFFEVSYEKYSVYIAPYIHRMFLD